MKKCSKCGTEKHPIDFYKNSSSADGRRTACRQCERKIHAERYQANRESRLELSRKWRRNNPEKMRALHQNWYHSFKKKHGCSPSRVQSYGTNGAEILAAQGNKCAICEKPITEMRYFTHIDHCHASGIVRGVLCRRCNLMLGQAQDRPEVLRAGAQYLEAHGVFA